jgi:hypothetical protein
MAKRSVGHIAEEKPVLSVEKKAETFNKTIRSIPTKLKKEFEDLKSEGKVHGSLNSYMVYALAQQLERDS